MPRNDFHNTKTGATPLNSRSSKPRFAMDEQTRDALSHGGEEAMREINARIRELLEFAPSDATAELEIRRDRHGFQGLLRIFSQQRRFVGGCRHKVFSEMIDHIFEEVWNQISEWKKEREASLDLDTK